MKAIQIKQYGGEEQLELVDVPQPQAGPGQVVVRVMATSFNPIDPKRASGVMRQIFPLQFPFIPGGDFSGVVDSVGEEVEAIKPGDQVFGYSLAGGAYAEFIAIAVDKIALKPKNATHIEAASLALVAQTALQMLDRAGVHRGQTVLILGAGGAVGSIAVQVAHERGATVIGIASSGSIDRLCAYGADRVIDYAATPFSNSAKDVDVVFDLVGGEVQQRCLRMLKAGGVLVATTQPPSQEEAANHHVSATMLLTETSTHNLQRVARLVEADQIKPFVGDVYPLGEVPQAWRDIRSKHVAGKVVFAVGEEKK
jgi:NADPH:quinone reductase-like Zn-dependent oxidoreductase